MARADMMPCVLAERASSDTGLHPGRVSDAPSALSEGPDLGCRLTLYDQYAIVLSFSVFGRNHLGNPGLRSFVANKPVNQPNAR